MEDFGIIIGRKFNKHHDESQFYSAKKKWKENSVLKRRAICTSTRVRSPCVQQTSSIVESFRFLFFFLSFVKAGRMCMF